MTPAAQTTRRSENLAFVFQELLTVGERLRSNRQQVADACADMHLAVERRGKLLFQIRAETIYIDKEWNRNYHK